MIEIVREVGALRARVREARQRGLTVGFVPTMGALHAGHARLLEAARQECGYVVASIFVNPLQFDRKDDLDKYPRTMEADQAVCEKHGTDLIFAPTVGEMYPAETLTFVESPELSRYLCGEFRPGHFRGVATVVLKLFNMVQADRAYFGEKDAQQLAIIRRMVLDLNVPVTVVGVPTVREEDGLALSSRNKLLTPEQRAIAPVLSQALRLSLELLEKGEKSVAVLRERALALIARYPEARVEYFEFTDPDTLTPLETVEGPALIAAAMWLGTTRLIDNVRYGL